ncbi:MAG: hypothetical protein QM758_20000 [Armatimonas sp.]
MKVYIIRQLHWEYQDYDNIYEIVDETPIKAYISKFDAESACSSLNADEKAKWKGPQQTTTREPMAQQAFFEVIEMDMEA